MREIKFRGKRINNGKWVYGSLLKINKKSYIYPRKRADLNDTDFGFGFIEVYPESVGQFTGMLDKKEKEVYECDILLVTPVGWLGKQMECDSCRQYLNVVEYVSDSFGREIRCKPFFHSYSSLEIVGNIFEHNIKDLKTIYER